MCIDMDGIVPELHEVPVRPDFIQTSREYRPRALHDPPRESDMQPPHHPRGTLRVGLLGFGVVGSGTHAVLTPL
jgi:hypothetical protein